MKIKKNREEIAEQHYLSINDIRVLLGIGYAKAKKTYMICDKIDADELGDWRIEENKIRMRTLLKVTGLPYNTVVGRK